MNNNYSIIMAGGIGSRFWPLSTTENPKQFLDVLGIGKSLLQMTYERMLPLSPKENIYILTNAAYKELVLKQLPELTEQQVLTEPERKNTAPCIAYAAAKLYALNPEANLIVTPADHLILQESNFVSTIQTALASSKNDRIATIGIRPTRPDTGYGYIEFEKQTEVSANDVFPVVQFREKPDLNTAEEFVKAGNFYWNAGIFIWRAKTVLEALKLYQPEFYELFAGDLSQYNTAEEQKKVNTCFASCTDISIDFAVMEHATNIDIVLANFDWSDLGTWGSLNMHLKKDLHQNAVIGDSVYLFDSSDCIVNIPNGKTALLDGLKGYIVIQSDDKLMILRKEKEQELKNYVSTIKEIKKEPV